MFRFLPVFCMVFIHALPCYSFKADFYSPFSHSEDYDDLLKTVASADRELRCRSIDEIDIGIGNAVELKELPRDLEPEMVLDFTTDTTKRQIIKRKAVYFKGSEIETFLRNEKHKDLLVVRVFGWFKQTDKETLLKKYNQLFDKLGYRRVLILGTDSSGTYVLSDSKDEQNSSGRKRTD